MSAQVTAWLCAGDRSVQSVQMTSPDPEDADGLPSKFTVVMLGACRITLGWMKGTGSEVNHHNGFNQEHINSCVSMELLLAFNPAHTCPSCCFIFPEVVGL